MQDSIGNDDLHVMLYINTFCTYSGKAVYLGWKQLQGKQSWPNLRHLPGGTGENHCDFGVISYYWFMKAVLFVQMVHRVIKEREEWQLWGWNHQMLGNHCTNYWTIYCTRYKYQTAWFCQDLNSILQNFVFFTKHNTTCLINI